MINWANGDRDNGTRTEMAVRKSVVWLRPSSCLHLMLATGAEALSATAALLQGAAHGAGTSTRRKLAKRFTPWEYCAWAW